MNWIKFNTHNESKENAFEMLANQIFRCYCEKNYKDKMRSFIVNNGSGGDGGIESYGELDSNEIIAIQSKAFFDAITSSKVAQIKKSIQTAISVRDNIKKYIVCVPRDLSNKRNGVINSERDKISKLFQEFKDTNIEFELWGDFEITNLLTTNDEMAGINKFWFDNVELTYSLLKSNFELQKNGWLKDRYNAKLHTNSNINYELEKIVGNTIYRKKHFNSLSKIQKTYSDYIELFEKLIEVVDEEDKTNVTSIYEQQKEQLLGINEYFCVLKEYLKNENTKIEFKEVDIIDTEWFYKLNKNYNNSMHYEKMRRIIELVETTNLNKLIRQIRNDCAITNLIIVGGLGTGKTHSVANQVEKELQNENVAIMIRASEVEINSSWRDIFVKKLGLSTTWSEDEIFLALSALAYRKEFEKTEEFFVNKKVLICVDGIDEHSNYDFWNDKQKEAVYLAQKYNRLRFCFSGRPYSYTNLDNIDKEYCKILNYDYSPGYNIDEMYSNYINEYRIKINNALNLRTYLDNPLAIKLFCQSNKGKRIDSINETDVSLAQLFKIKIEKMNEEFVKNNIEVFCDDAISRTARIIIDYLYRNEKIYQKEIFEFMNDDDELSGLSNENKAKIIKSLQKYGLLDCEIIEESFGRSKKFYSKGMQPVVDYIMAVNLANEITCKKYNIDDNIRKNVSILQLAALILFEENDILILDIAELNVSKRLLEKVSIYAIVNSNPIKVSKLKDRIKEIMLKNAKNMRYILNSIIIPCARVANHPLGAQFLNEILNDYNTMGDRDKIWSLPEGLEDIYYVYEPLIINKDNMKYYLNKYDTNNGLPIIYMWLLTRTDNLELMFYRNQLMQWALMCPNEFVLLFNNNSKINDVQVLEQLYAIAMCLCYKTKDNDIISQILNISKRELYDGEYIKSCDFQIRTYLRAIAERAYKSNLLSAEELTIYIPPYKCKKEMTLHKMAYKHGTRMGGYKIIDYDLARYVLCDYLGARFFDHYYNYYNEKEECTLEQVFSKKELMENKEKFIGNKEYEKALANCEKNDKLEDILINLDYLDKRKRTSEKDVKTSQKLNIDDMGVLKINKNNNLYNRYGKKTVAFLEREIKKAKIKEINEDKFIIAAAYQYIQDCGWNEEEFYGTDKIDSQIRRRYYAATHGGKSSVMCMAEKYIWCFRNEIIGYLADYLYKDKEEKEKYINYAEIDDVLIPIIEYEQQNNEESEFVGNFLPEKVFTYEKLKDIEEIKKWIGDTTLNLDFEKWLYINYDNNSYVTLSTFNSFTDIKNYVELNMWISAAIIKNEDVKYLKDNINNNQENLCRVVNNPDDFKEYTNVEGAKTPLEIINFDWYDRNESEYKNISLLNEKINKYSLFKTYEEAYNLHTEYVEMHYKIPSLKIREMLKINNNQGFKYMSDDKIVSFYETNNNKWDDFHTILVASQSLENKLKKNNEQLIWFFRIDKLLSVLGREKYKDVHDRKEITGVLLGDEMGLKTYLLKFKEE